ncbi:conserved hypothetical protein [Xanthomonas phaseoli pv. phaseoli]|uniref:Uncharacterized protein n=1 Tax=Xanthomonas campestris pv. phaseoli TaxID=317013 RepID=A0AB38E1P2_XANCH|nr:conserved hypothetical protein [Xanthomonas phaseoli pv. phaseoli]SON86476.1 conserved hypothetical protein [Xanthomonas phaseoli pv. phaseoli]SON90796.1 conserved hypothetical protein [Xanthomonas phaseoli pv. phaseoli]SOO28301.1 hypothetical protein XAP6164_2320041 [Xanthomonas phaseoli pv. phaseoli]
MFYTVHSRYSRLRSGTVGANGGHDRFAGEFFPALGFRVKAGASRNDCAAESQMQCLPRAVSSLRRGSKYVAVAFHPCW